MSSFITQFFPNIPTNPSLPVSCTDSKSKQQEGGLRRRLSSMSLKIQGKATPVSASSCPFPRSSSLSSRGNYAGTSMRKWWDWAWAWILSRKPIFARDLEMNEQETKVLSSRNKGSWRHVFYKLRSEIRSVIGSDHADLPQTYRYEYDSLHYSNNFDDARTRSAQG